MLDIDARCSPCQTYQKLPKVSYSWIEKKCPKQWKKAEIVTIPKPGKDPSLTTSYHPNSLLSCTSKLMERLVQTRMQYFLESKNVLHPSQAGFRRGRSTNEQIHRLTQTIVDGFQKHQRSLVVYVNFTKAYDRSGARIFGRKWVRWAYRHVLLGRLNPCSLTDMLT